MVNDIKAFSIPLNSGLLSYYKGWGQCQDVIPDLQKNIGLPAAV